MSIQSFNPVFVNFIMFLTSKTFKNVLENIFKSYLYYCSFTKTQLFGLAPELSPVYHHILWKWRNYKGVKFKMQRSKNLNGLNSGVIMSYLERIRKSSDYNRLISPEWISSVVQKYLFKVSFYECINIYIYIYMFRNQEN